VPKEVVTSPDYDISPDGTQIVFVANEKRKNSNWEKGSSLAREFDVANLYLINVDGTGQKQLTFFDGRSYFGHPRWSPDGTKILFYAGDKDRPRKVLNENRIHQPATLYTIDRDGGNLKNLLIDLDLFGWDGSWSPDGKKIVFSKSDANNIRNIWLLDLRNNSAKSVTEGAPNKWTPIFSPDGTQILYVAYSRGLYGGGSELFVMDVDGSNVRRVMAPHITKFGWSEVSSPDWIA
jgi:Tol biopolymer transport system component